MTEPATARVRRLPGVDGLWAFVAVDLTLFGFLFAAAALSRADGAAAFVAAAADLHQGIGFVNVVLLLTSSWSVALAVHAVRGGHAEACRRLVLATASCGVAFAGLKALEYSLVARHDATTGAQPFLTLYVTLTGLHLAHVIIGVVALLGTSRTLGRRRETSASVALVESVATYWHMVDLLWVWIFVVLYLAA